MNDPLDLALAAGRSVRWWGSALVVVGIALEIAIDLLWSEPSPTETFRRTSKLKGLPAFGLKGLAVLAVGALVVWGLVKETNGDESIDQTVDKMRVEQLTRIADTTDRAAHAEQEADASNKRATIAEERLRRTARLISGIFIIEDSPNLRKFSGFPKAPLFIKTTDFRTAGLIDHSAEDAKRYAASLRFAASFKLLTIPGWTVNNVGPNLGRDLVLPGIELLSWRDSPNTPGTPEDHRQAAATAEALRCFLILEFGIWPTYHDAGILPEFPGLPANGVLIEVGEIVPQDELARSIDEEKFNDCADWANQP